MAKKQHILHHYKNEKFWFGVSNPVFDFIFGTLKDGKDVELSETARNLEKEKRKSSALSTAFVLMRKNK